MADSLATLAMQEYVGKGNTELIPARDSNRVWYAYTQAKGGKKMRLTGFILKCFLVWLSVFVHCLLSSALRSAKARKRNTGVILYWLYTSSVSGYMYLKFETENSCK